jgi:hypothetical protein
VKIRLTGTPDEVTAAAHALNDCPSLLVREISRPYPNRGDSTLVRVYLDAKAQPPTAE